MLRRVFLSYAREDVTLAQLTAGGSMWILLQSRRHGRARDDAVSLWAPTTSSRGWTVLVATAAVAVPPFVIMVR
jgi:hypothetical protein